MSTNRTRELLYRPIAKSTGSEAGKQRIVLVSEHDNSQDFNKSNHATYFTDDVYDVTFLAHTYVRIECLIQYFETRFEHCEITITDRFTMDSTKIVLAYNDITPHESADKCWFNKRTKDEHYSIVQYAWDKTERVDDDERLNGRKFTSVTLLLSMCDFPHFGDIDFQFYGVHENEKDRYSDPIIVQFTNAPTVIAGNLYKWHPHNSLNTPDYDNVFNDKFGAFWNYDTNKRGTPDVGRTNVLTANVNNEYYNDYLSADRLITNGVRYWSTADSPDEILNSFSGHPVYIAHYETFIPEAFEETYGVVNDRSTVRFEPYAANATELGKNCCAYLTHSANYTTSATQDEAFKTRIVQVEDNKRKEITVITGDDIIDMVTYGRYQRFNVYLGCISGRNADYDLRDGNGTTYNDRPDDAWFRTHTLLHADFVLSGVDPYWLSNTEEFMTDYADRNFNIITHFDDYVPPVLERKWAYHTWGTRYYVLQKGKYDDRYNPENWTRIYNYPNGNYYDDKSVVLDSSELTHDIEVDDDGVPILILEHTGNVGEDIDIRHTYYDDTIGYTCSFILSCDDSKTNPGFFKIMDLITTAKTRTVIFRVSDMAFSRSDFSRNNADAEWAITVKR